MAEEPKSGVNRFPIELSFLSGLALGACNMHFMMLGTAMCWFILRKLRSGLAKPVVLALSGNLSQLVLGFIGVAMGFLDFDTLTIAELSAMFVVSILLLSTGSPIWTWILSLHAVGIIAYRLYQSPDFQSNTPQSRAMAGSLLIQALVIWLLFPYLFRSAILPTPANPVVDQPPSDPPPPADQGETACATA